uniref:Choline O-acetyltransferase n=1 Tax=Protohermes xanthodes TaxID=1452977 RepID=A0AAU6PBV7_9NEOP
MERYLIAMQPLVTTSQLERTRAIVKAFSAPGAHGTRLQLYLNEQRELKDNWAYEYWINDMYMNNPLPLPVNSNPGMVFPPRKFTTVHDVARYAARLLDGVLDHKEILDKKALPIERATSREKGQPLCMTQYYRLLTSCRMPGKVQDSLYSRLEDNQDVKNNNEHIIVACRNQFYCVAVKATDRGRLTEDEICSQFLHILNDAPCLASPPPVGLLTGDNRRKWGDNRESLYQDERNRRNLDLIAKSLLLICLDEPLPANFNARALRTSSSSSASGNLDETNRGGYVGYIAGHRDETNMAHQMLHGGGSSLNSANRWFDKTVQFVISNDGVNGLCYEHSPAEGIAVIQLIEQLLKKCDELPPGSHAPATLHSHLPPPERLEWQLDARMHRSIQEAAQNIDGLVEDLDLYVHRFTGYGKNYIKSCNVSPDVYLQLALQLTYFRLYGHLVTTYESASTRRYHLGRVDCIRSATQEALNWVTAMCQGEGGGLKSPPDSEVSDDELLNMGKKVTFSLYTEQKKLELWDAAVKRQTEIMIDNIMGQGIDIHLLGLREAARETAPTAAHPLPDIFLDETYRIANNFLLSTSQLPTTSDTFMGYGPVVPDGYGASYNPHPDMIVFCLSAFHSSETTSTWKFAHSLEESLTAMQKLTQLKNSK